MPDSSPVLSMLALIGYLAIAYVVGRLLIGLIAVQPGGIARATSPILGGSALAIQLWIYGVAHIPWSQVWLLVPWLIVALVRRRDLRDGVLEDIRDTASGIRELTSRSGPLELVFLSGILILAFVYLLNLVTQPVLGWDAIAMWLYKANLYYAHQSVTLAPIALDDRRNLDYPPLFSLLVDSLYVVSGTADDILGKAVTYLFIPSGVVGFLVIARSLVGWRLSVTFTFLLTAMPIFLNAIFNFPYMGWADYPIAILMLLSLLHLVDAYQTRNRMSYSLAIVFAALAAFTKNEGLSFLGLMLLVVVLPPVMTALRGRRWPELRPATAGVVLLGVAPLVAWELYLRINGFHGARLVSQGTWTELLPGIPHRFIATLQTIRHFFSFKLDYPWLVAGYVLSIVLIAVRRSQFGIPVLFIVSAQALSYFVVYLITPFDIQYIVSVTLDRLLLQLAPSVVLLLAVALNPYVSRADRVGQAVDI